MRYAPPVAAIIAALLAAPAAFAQDTVPVGTTFTVRDLSTADAYYPTRSSLVGVQCTATAPMTLSPGTSWYGGAAKCAGTDYYFYQAMIDVQKTFGSKAVTYMNAGTSFIVRDIASDDAYYASKSGMIGLSCIAGSGMTRTDSQWWAGPAVCNGTSYYFYKMAFDIAAGAPSQGYGSATISSITAGSTFVLRDIASDDAYYSSKSSMVGLSCVAGADMTRTDGQWWAGSATCGGSSYYFYKAAFDVTSVAAYAPAPSTTYGSASISSVPTGAGFVIRDIASDDAYYSSRSSMLGLQCVAGAGMSRTDGQWWGGAATCNGTSYYFYKAAFDLTSTGSSYSGGYASASVSTPLSPGSQVIVRDVATDDAFYATRTEMIGQTCTVAADLHRNDGQWWGGDVNCSNGKYYYFYKMAFDLASGGSSYVQVASGTWASASAPATLAAGTQFVIREIASDDAYYSSAGPMLGVTCTVAADLHRTDGQWYGGDANCSNGSYYYFYKMAFDWPYPGYVPPAAAVSSGGSYGSASAPDSLSAGTSFTIREIASDDAYYSSASSMIGLSCTVAADMHRNDGQWYGGDANCSNGSYYYFYKVAFDLGGGGGGVASTTGSDRYRGYSVPKNAYVTVADVSADDAFYAYKSSLVGQSCQVKKGDLTTTGDGWFSGTLKCGGTKLYFYQVGVYY